jgi:hypothetical protein
VIVTAAIYADVERVGDVFTGEAGGIQPVKVYISGPHFRRCGGQSPPFADRPYRPVPDPWHARSVWRCSQGPKKVECFQIFLANARMTLSQDRVFVKLKGEIAMIRIYTRENALQRNNSDGSRLGDRESVKAMLAPVTRLFRLVFV